MIKEAAAAAAAAAAAQRVKKRFTCFIRRPICCQRRTRQLRTPAR